MPTGKIEPKVTQGRADVGHMPTAETLGSLAGKVLSSSRHAESRELARAVLELLALLRPGTFWSHGGAFATAVITLMDC